MYFSLIGFVSLPELHQGLILHAKSLYHIRVSGDLSKFWGIMFPLFPLSVFPASTRLIHSKHGRMPGNTNDYPFLCEISKRHFRVSRTEDMALECRLECSTWIQHRPSVSGYLHATPSGVLVRSTYYYIMHCSKVNGTSPEPSADYRHGMK